MKQIFLLFSILFFVTCVDDDLLGPAHNLEERISPYSCSDLYVNQKDVWLDNSQNIKGDILPSGVSDCIDLQLWSKQSGKYYDKCCYVRFQLNGQMHAGCVGLSQFHYSDITETKRKMEQGDINIWTRKARNSKIYQLDCGSSYLNYISVAAILLFGLLL